MPISETTIETFVSPSEFLDVVLDVAKYPSFLPEVKEVDVISSSDSSMRARFDVAVLRHHLGIEAGPIYCTKIASRLVRTYTDRHGLKDLCSELIGVELSKQQQSSDWAAETLSQQQIAYAASDVLHLHALKRVLDGMLERESRRELANAAFQFLP